MKKYITIIAMIFMLLAISNTAYATDITSTDSNVTFCITDETGEYSGSPFIAIMTDNTGTIKDSYEFSAGNSWGSNRNPIYTMTAPATYTVTIDGIDKGYEIIDTLTRSRQLTFDAPVGGEQEVLWSIVKSKDKIKNEESKDNITSQDKIEASESDASIEEADEIYNNFLKATAFIADDRTWENNVLTEYRIFESRYAAWYKSYVDNGTEEEFLEMDLYDRFLWGETYLMFAWAINSGTFNDFFGDKESYTNRITDNLTIRINNARELQNKQQVIDAYLALADWQYEYIKKNGVPFNFIKGRNYLVEIGEKISTKTDVQSDDGVISETQFNDTAAEKGIWDDTINVLAKNTITILIFVVLIVVLLLVIRQRKRLNKDDDTDNDTNLETTTDK